MSYKVFLSRFNKGVVISFYWVECLIKHGIKYVSSICGRRVTKKWKLNAIIFYINMLWNIYKMFQYALQATSAMCILRCDSLHSAQVYVEYGKPEFFIGSVCN